MTKAELRAHYKARRAALTPGAVTDLSQRIADQFFADNRIRATLTAPGAVLHTYLPIRRQHEVDTGPIVQRVRAEWPAVRVLSSVADPATHTLTSFDLLPDTALTENRWGIPEPTLPPAPVDCVPTLVLVPLLTFDERGHRVGYGGGYYDRFLATLPAACLTVGLSFYPALKQIADLEATDIRLHGYVLPNGLRWIVG